MSSVGARLGPDNQLSRANREASSVVVLKQGKYWIDSVDDMCSALGEKYANITFEQGYHHPAV